MNAAGTLAKVGPGRSHPLQAAANCLEWGQPTEDERLAEAYAKFGRHAVHVIGAHYPWNRLGSVAVETFRCDDGLVYFVGSDTGPIKIGYTTLPLCRLASMQLGSPLILKFLAVRRAPISIEKAYHKRFAEHRSHGEWFHRHPDILKEIGRLKQLRPALRQTGRGATTNARSA